MCVCVDVIGVCVYGFYRCESESLGGWVCAYALAEADEEMARRLQFKMDAQVCVCVCV